MHNAHIMQIAQCTIYSNRRVGIQVTTVLPLSHIFHIFSSETHSPHFLIRATFLSFSFNRYFSSFFCRSYILLIFLSELHFSHFLYIGISPHFLSELHSHYLLFKSTFSSFSYQRYILHTFFLELHSSHFLILTHS